MGLQKVVDFWPQKMTVLSWNLGGECAETQPNIHVCLLKFGTRRWSLFNLICKHPKLLSFTNFKLFKKLKLDMREILSKMGYFTFLLPNVFIPKFHRFSVLLNFSACLPAARGGGDYLGWIVANGQILLSSSIWRPWEDALPFFLFNKTPNNNCLLRFFYAFARRRAKVSLTSMTLFFSWKTFAWFFFLEGRSF